MGEGLETLSLRIERHVQNAKTVDDGFCRPPMTVLREPGSIEERYRLCDGSVEILVVRVSAGA
ncbi:hypothetical protein AB0L63_23995 [Nocardia sp. NPDC051990]|uniref:hypothetical protein n=1 Tax=Nocardia sp. NPDC051990 TaxID=3155285 RepID=UPI0034314EAC